MPGPPPTAAYIFGDDDNDESEEHSEVLVESDDQDEDEGGAAQMEEAVPPPPPPESPSRQAPTTSPKSPRQGAKGACSYGPHCFVTAQGHVMPPPIPCQLGLPGCANSVHHSCQTSYHLFVEHEDSFKTGSKVCRHCVDSIVNGTQVVTRSCMELT